MLCSLMGLFKKHTHKKPVSIPQAAAVSTNVPTDGLYADDEVLDAGPIADATATREGEGKADAITELERGPAEDQAAKLEAAAAAVEAAADKAVERVKVEDGLVAAVEPAMVRAWPVDTPSANPTINKLRGENMSLFKELKDLSSELDVHLAKMYPEISPSEEQLEKQSRYITMLDALQVEQQKNRMYTDDFDLLEREEAETRAAQSNVRRLQQQLKMLQDEQTSILVMNSRVPKFEGDASPNKHEHVSPASLEALEEVRSVTNQIREACREGHSKLQINTERSRKVHLAYSNALIHQKLMKTCKAVVDKDGTDIAKAKVMEEQLRDLKRSLVPLRKKRDVVQNSLRIQGQNGMDVKRTVEFSLETLEQEKEALEAEIKYREMERDLAAVEVEELAAAVETRLKELESAVGPGKGDHRLGASGPTGESSTGPRFSSLDRARAK